MPYKVIAHRRPEALGGRHHPFQTAPALVADEQGRLGVIHDAQRQFVPLPPEGQREALSQVLGEPHNWHRYPRGSQPDWTPGSVVKSDAQGGSYLDPNEPQLTPADAPGDGTGMGQDGATLPAAGQDAGDTGDGTSGEDDGATPDTQSLPELQGPPNTAPRQQGRLQVMRGKATNAGEPFDYEMPLTTCASCVSLQPALLQIKPCRQEATDINLADFGFYSNSGGCPFYQFGMTLPADGGGDIDADDSPAGADVGSDTIQPGTFQMAEGDDASGFTGDVTGDTPEMVRGALIQLLGGEVTGAVSQNVTLVGPPTTSTGDEQAPPDPSAGDSGEDQTDGDADSDESFAPDAFPSGAKPDAPAASAAVQMSDPADYPPLHVHTDAIAEKLKDHPAFQRFAKSVASGEYPLHYDSDYDGRPMHHAAGKSSPGQFAAESLGRYWTTYGGSGFGHAVAMQRAVRTELGAGKANLSHVSDAANGNADRLAIKHPDLQPAMRAWARAQYDHTQEHYAQQGVTHVDLSRGLRIPHDALAESASAGFMPRSMATALQNDAPYRKENASVNLQPMSSFTTSPETSEAFSYPSGDSHSVRMGMRVPVTSILGSHETGLGTHGQDEHIVLGGKHTASVTALPTGTQPTQGGAVNYPVSRG